MTVALTPTTRWTNVARATWVHRLRLPGKPPVRLCPSPLNPLSLPVAVGRSPRRPAAMYVAGCPRRCMRPFGILLSRETTLKRGICSSRFSLQRLELDMLPNATNGLGTLGGEMIYGQRRVPIWPPLPPHQLLHLTFGYLCSHRGPARFLSRFRLI